MITDGSNALCFIAVRCSVIVGTARQDREEIAMVDPVLAQDQYAYRWLLSRYRDRVVLVVAATLGGPADAEDAAWNLNFYLNSPEDIPTKYVNIQKFKYNWSVDRYCYIVTKGHLMLVVTTENIPGFRVTQVFGQVFGVVVRSRGIGGDIVAGLRSIVGGEITEFTEMLEDARKHAIDRMVQNATIMGANAIVMMRFDGSEIGQSMSEVVAYGTAVAIEQHND
jgi:uncharacterized protein YbjQ (UPF0145 family)